VPTSVADQPVTFTLHATNTGLLPITGVTVTDVPPSDVIFGNVSTDTGTCTAAPPISCAIGSLAGGASATITVTVTPIAAGTIENQASATSDQVGPVQATGSAAITADPSVTYIAVNDAGFSPAVETAALGSTVQFNAFGGASREVMDGLGLYDSGVLSPVAYTQTAFPFAAAYALTDAPTGHTAIFKSAPVVPATAPNGTPFTVAWATAPIPAGYDEDIQVYYPDGTGWVAWKTNQTVQSGSFTPTHGAGTYRFRARIQRTGGTASAYGSPASVAVN
jgi:uncharacterized repeat protein (TIGR01451 family)